MHLMLAAEDLQEGKDVPITDFTTKIPFIETERATGKLGAEIFQSLDPPRIMKSHLPYYSHWKQQLDKHPNMRVMQIIRNLKDTLVSFYHHIKNERLLGGSPARGTNISTFLKKNDFRGAITLRS